jgi:ABC-type transport system substrate-binding protein
MNNTKKILTVVLIAALLASLIAPLTAIAQSTSPLFKVTIIAPGNANLLRRQWSQVFASNLQSLGIDAKVVYLGWQSVYDRVLTPLPEFVGKTYDQLGYDIEAMGWTPGLLPEPRQLFYGGDPAFFAPTGQNYYLWDNAQSNSLLDTFITSTSDTEKADVLSQWQKLYFDEVPASQILFEQSPAIVNPAIGNLYKPAAGEGWLYFNAQPYPQLLTRSDGKTQIVYCATSEITALNPPESNSWYDTIITVPIYGGLAMAWPSISGSVSDLEVPDLLTSWTHNAAGTEWTFNCRQGVTWHDGEPFTADDIVFSIWALMGGVPDSQFAGYYQSVYGDKCTFAYSNGTLATLGNGTREGIIAASADKTSVTLQLPILAMGKPYGYFEPYMLSFANNIIPMHIFENIPPVDWATSPFNTGQGEMTINGKTYYGPVGTGPYMWQQGSYDVTAQSVHLVRFDNYWNATALKNDGKFQIKDYYIRFIADKTAAIAALKNGEVDMLDPNYQMSADIPSIDSAWGKVIMLNGRGRQEFGYNMRHPIFGTGVDTPLGKSDPSRAAEAAKYVRTAFDYAVPRELIINNLLAGYGEPGVTPMLPTQPFYDNTVTARPFDLNQAKNYLQMAGYTPSAVVGKLTGTLTNPDNSVKNGTAVKLFVTNDNSTFPSGLTEVAQTTTDQNGFWSFDVNPTTPGTYYYYLQDTDTGDYKYIQSITVSPSGSPTPTSSASASPSPTQPPTSTDMTWVYVAIAVVVIIIIIAAVALLMRKKPKPA